MRGDGGESDGGGGGESDGGGGGESDGGGGDAATITAAQRARLERQRSRALALREARLRRPPPADTGGGFLPRDEEPPPRAAPPPAPPPLRSEWPRCDECARPFPTSHLLEAFELSACDECRDEGGAHALVTRTEARGEYLLRECDLDSRPPPLRCVRRANPHRGGAPMRLYLRAQVEERAHLVWGGAAGLRAERERRDERRRRAASAAAARELRALRLQTRGSRFAPVAAGGAGHVHEWGPETRAADGEEDSYRRECSLCGHCETYEKM